MSLLGKYFQVRDDYMNLMDNDVRAPILLHINRI
jgi:hypothetical protein